MSEQYYFVCLEYDTKRGGRTFLPFNNASDFDNWYGEKNGRIRNVAGEDVKFVTVLGVEMIVMEGGVTKEEAWNFFFSLDKS